VNLSGDKEQDYFSDGLTEELLNSLSRINELQVAGRTSSFYFKGEHADLTTIAHKLNVATVLEGSVRRSAHTVRVSAHLINAETGFHLWSETYDRDLGDVLKLETEIANAVASALRITLLGDTAAKIELGGTRSPAAQEVRKATPGVASWPVGIETHDLPKSRHGLLITTRMKQRQAVREVGQEREIYDCALFVPIISANTASRQEGYFRLEWDLADQRTHMTKRARAAAFTAAGFERRRQVTPA
jgi:TolB-like protein